MGARFPFQANSISSAVNIVTTTETVILTSAPFSTSFDNQAILILCSMWYTPGTGTGSVQRNLRRGALATSPLVQATTNDVLINAGILYPLTVMWMDNPGVIAGVQYSFTILQNGASGNGSVSFATLALLAL